MQAGSKGSGELAFAQTCSGAAPARLPKPPVCAALTQDGCGRRQLRFQLCRRTLESGAKNAVTRS